MNFQIELIYSNRQFSSLVLDISIYCRKTKMKNTWKANTEFNLIRMIFLNRIKRTNLNNRHSQMINGKHGRIYKNKNRVSNKTKNFHRIMLIYVAVFFQYILHYMIFRRKNMRPLVDIPNQLNK